MAYGLSATPDYVVIAGLGCAATLLSVWLTARFQNDTNLAGQMQDARLRDCGGCADSLIEYSRATYDRAKLRLADKPEAERDGVRQEAYRCNARARSAIGQVNISLATATWMRSCRGSPRIGGFKSAGQGGSGTAVLDPSLPSKLGHGSSPSCR